jgi:hypothetical protein
MVLFFLLFACALASCPTHPFRCGCETPVPCKVDADCPARKLAKERKRKKKKKSAAFGRLLEPFTPHL